MSREKSEENHSNSPSACGKVFSSIICCRCHQDEDIADHQLEHMPASGAPNPSLPTNHHTAKTSDVQAERQKAEAAGNKLEVPSKAKVGVETNPEVKDRGKKSGLAMNDTFSDYIRRAKMKIRNVSNPGSASGHGKIASEVVAIHDTKKDDNAKDVFSDYINRAKMKIKRTSSGGSRKS